MTKKLYQDEFEYNGKTYTAQEEYLTNWKGELNDYTSLVVQTQEGAEIVVDYHQAREALESAQVGDVIMLCPHRGNSALALVEKATKTQVTVNGKRYMRRTGKQVGNNTCRATNVDGYVEANLASTKAYNRRKAYNEALRERRDAVHSAINDAVAKADDAMLDRLAELLGVVND